MPALFMYKSFMQNTQVFHWCDRLKVIEACMFNVYLKCGQRPYRKRLVHLLLNFKYNHLK